MLDKELKPVIDDNEGISTKDAKNFDRKENMAQAIIYLNVELSLEKLFKIVRVLNVLVQNTMTILNLIK